MEIKNRNFKTFYQTPPKEVFIPVNAALVLDSLVIKQLVYLAINSVSKHHIKDTEAEYYVRHFSVSYIEHNPKKKEIIIYYELKSKYFKDRYVVFEKTALFPNNIISFRFN